MHGRKRSRSFRRSIDTQSEGDTNPPKKSRHSMSKTLQPQLTSTPFRHSMTSKKEEGSISGNMNQDREGSDDGSKFSNGSFLDGLLSDDRSDVKAASRDPNQSCEQSSLRVKGGLPSQTDLFSLHSGISYSHSGKKKKWNRLDTSYKMKDNNDGLSVISVPSKVTQLVFLNYPASVAITGLVEVSVLRGSVALHGYEMKEGQKVTVFSSEFSMCQRLSIMNPKAALVEKNKLHSKLKEICTEEGQKQQLAYLMKRLEKTTAVVELKRKPLPSSLQFLELYFPTATQFSLDKNSPLEKICVEEATNVFKMSDIGAAREIIADIEQSSFNHTDGPRILISGPKNAGKSTMLRYLVNQVLSQTNEAAYVLDADPGQAEFTPPGIVSLTKVTHPILSPAYVHQRDPIKMIFTGSVTAYTSPEMYIKCIRNLIKLYQENFSEGVLFVNTMGWMEGIGLMCLEDIARALKPTIFIEFVENESETEPEVLSDGTKKYKIACHRFLKDELLSARDLRNMSLLHYFGKSLSYYMKPVTLNEIRPVCVCWDNIAICVADKKVPATRLIEAIQCSVVALCRVDESCMLESERPEYPRTILDESVNECLGFGFVRAADESQHLLYVVTPLDLDILRRVNTIIKGNIMIPDEVILKQNVVGVSLPYTDRSLMLSGECRNPVSLQRQKYF